MVIFFVLKRNKNKETLETSRVIKDIMIIGLRQNFSGRQEK